MSEGEPYDAAKALKLAAELLRARRKYVKPKILSEGVFERMAGCGKSAPVTQSCFQLPSGGS